MTGKVVDLNTRQVAALLHAAALEYLETPGVDPSAQTNLPHDVDSAEFVSGFKSWVGEISESGTLDRYHLEKMFSIAEAATSNRKVIEALSDLWDEIDAAFPAPDDDAFYGSQAEVTGDYSRIYFPKPRRPE